MNAQILNTKKTLELSITVFANGTTILNLEQLFEIVERNCNKSSHCESSKKKTNLVVDIICRDDK